MNFKHIKSILPFDLSPTRVIILGYLIVIFTGAALLSSPQATQPGIATPFLDALFTSTSAVCVTGLIVVNTAAHWSLFGQIVILVLIQIGGLGIMTLSTLAILIIGKKIMLSRRLLIQQDIGHLSQSGLLKLVQYIVTLTFVAEAAGAALIFSTLRGDMGLLRAVWFSIFHSISAFNNAGFDIFGNSLENFITNPVMNLTIIALIILGGLGFTVIYEFGRKIFNRKNLSTLSLHSKTVLAATVILLVVGLAVIYSLEMDNPDTIKNLSGGHRFLASFFLSVTTRTAGFNTVPTGALKSATLVFIIFLMYVGASPGSTGGGVKTTTFTALLQQVNSYVMGKQYVSVYNRRLSRYLIRKAMVICFLALMLIFSTSLLLSITEAASYIDILFEATSAFGTVGLSTGITGELSKPGRLIIIILMFAGRLGPLTFAIGLRRVRAHKTGYRYPEEDIMVG
jgi:trk system potassium uptake protein TrkH